MQMLLRKDYTMFSDKKNKLLNQVLNNASVSILLTVCVFEIMIFL